MSEWQPPRPKVVAVRPKPQPLDKKHIRDIMDALQIVDVFARCSNNREEFWLLAQFGMETLIADDFKILRMLLPGK